MWAFLLPVDMYQNNFLGGGKLKALFKEFTMKFRLNALAFFISLALVQNSSALELDATESGYESSSDETFSGITVNNGNEVSLSGSSITINRKDSFNGQLNVIRVSDGEATETNNLILGSSQTQSINVTIDNSSGVGMTNGIISQKNGHIEINGENFVMSVVGADSPDENNVSDTYAIAAQGFGSRTDPLLSFIEINAKNTVINVEQNIKDPSAAAFMAYGRGSITVNGNLEVNAPYVIVSRGYSQVLINPKGGSTVKLNGDVAFAYNGITSGTAIDANVSINLDSPDSYWNGNTQAIGNPPSGYDQVTGMELGLSNRAQWTTDQSSFLNKLQINNGVMNVIGGENQEVTIDKMGGTGGDINLTATTDGETVQSASVSIGEASAETTLKVTTVGFTADDVTDVESVMQSMNEKVTLSGEEEQIAKIQKIGEGDIRGEYIQSIAGDGTKSAVKSLENTKLASFRGLNATALVAWRDEVAYTNQRMEFLRDNSHAYGAWAQVYGGESKYEDKAELTTTTVQVGADMAVGDWVAGAAFSYMTGEADMLRGDADTDAYTLSLYAERNFDSGLFVNGLARYGRLSTDATAGNMDASYDNNAFSLGGNVGYRFTFAEQAFVEPNFGLQYAYVMGDDYKASNGVKVEQDDFDALIASLGARVGFNFPNNAGKVFARASVNHDFLGEIDGTASKANLAESMYMDLGGTWVTYGVGTQFNITDNLSVWGNVDRTTGGEVSTNYMMNAGLRYVF